MRKKALLKKIARDVLTLYHGAKMKTKVVFKLSEELLVQVGVQQGSVMLSQIITIVADVITENAREDFMNDSFYPNDLVLVSKI